VVYGCSYTAGSELIDHEIVEKSQEWVDNFKRTCGMNEWFKFVDKTLCGEKYNNLLKMEKQRSWAGHLAKMLGIPCENKAVAGCSLEGMIYFYEKDKRKFIEPDDLVIFGLTGPARFMRIDSDGNPINHILGHSGGWSSKIQKSYISLMGNDDTSLWQAYRDISHMERICMQNKNAYMQNIWATFHTYNGVFCNSASKHMLELINDPEYWPQTIANEYSLWTDLDYDDETCQHGGGHPFECYHIKFAERLYKKIISW